MKSRMLTRGVIIGAAVALMGALAVEPALAQQSSLRGKVVDEAGNPVEGAKVILEPTGNYDTQFEVTTNDKGEWFKGGLAGFGGGWKVTVTKDDLAGVNSNVRAQLGAVTAVPDIVLKPGGLAALNADPANMSTEEIDKANEETEKLNALFAEASTAFDAKNYDLAIEKVNGMIASVENCDVCYDLLGDINVAKEDLAAAEAAYLKSIEIKPDKPAPYNALASIYNTQRKFEEAADMSAKANEVSGADPMAGGGDASASYNQGISLWNAGKAAEAVTAFKRATELDPAMADAHYWLGMASVNLGQLPAAKTACSV